MLGVAADSTSVEDRAIAQLLTITVKYIARVDSKTAQTLI